MKQSSAFTLVELLVAFAITVVLVLLLTSVVAATLGAWTQGRNRLDTSSKARGILDRLTDELKGATANLAVSGSRIQFVENATLGGVSSPTPGATENLFFVAPHPNPGPGDLCAIAYSLDADSHELKRAFRSSDQVWADPANGRYQVAGYTYTSTDWHVIATGVVQFELQCFSQNDLDNNLTPAYTWDSGSTDVFMAGKAPRRIVLRVQVVDDRATTQLAGMTVGSEPYKFIVQRSVQQVSTEVSLPPP